MITRTTLAKVRNGKSCSGCDFFVDCKARLDLGANVVCETPDKYDLMRIALGIMTKAEVNSLMPYLGTTDFRLGFQYGSIKSGKAKRTKSFLAGMELGEKLKSSAKNVTELVTYQPKLKL